MSSLVVIRIQIKEKQRGAQCAPPLPAYMVPKDDNLNRVKFFETKPTEQAQKEFQGIQCIARRQKLIKLTDKSEHDWATVNEYRDDELASDAEDRKAVKSAKTKVQKNIRKEQTNESQRSKNSPPPKKKLYSKNFYPPPH